MFATSWIVIGLVSFVVGGAIPIVDLWLLKGYRRARNLRRPLGVIEALTADVVSFGVGGTALIYLASVDKRAAPVIGLAAIAGLGLVRWRRGGL